MGSDDESEEDEDADGDEGEEEGEGEEEEGVGRGSKGGAGKKSDGKAADKQLAAKQKYLALLLGGGGGGGGKEAAGGDDDDEEAEEQEGGDEEEEAEGFSRAAWGAAKVSGSFTDRYGNKTVNLKKKTGGSGDMEVTFHAGLEEFGAGPGLSFPHWLLMVHLCTLATSSSMACPLVLKRARVARP
jgi:hypothetical protein